MKTVDGWRTGGGRWRLCRQEGAGAYGRGCQCNFPQGDSVMVGQSSCLEFEVLMAVNRRIILKWILKKYGLKYRRDLSGHA